MVRPLKDYISLNTFFCIILIIFILAFMIFLSFRNYLLFHTTIELFSIIVAFGITIIAVNSFHSDNYYIKFIGIGYAFVGGFDLLHTLGYAGMGVFTNSSISLSSQLWIIARYFEAITLLAANFFINNRFKGRYPFLVFSGISILSLSSIFYFENFPDTFINGHGLTPFKNYNEYIIISLFAAGLFLLFKNKNYFNTIVFRQLALAYLVTISGEIFFTLYISVYDIENMIGHLFKLVSFYLLYKAVLETKINSPYLELAKKEALLKEANEQLEHIYSRISDGFFSLNSNWEISYLNNNAAQFFSERKDLLIGKPFNEIIDQDSLVYNKCIESMSHQKKMEFEAYIERISHYFVFYLYPSVDGISVYFRDITETKESQKEIERLDQLKIVGNMAATIAHEVRNPLTVVGGFIQLMDSKEKNQQNKDYYRLILNELDRVNSIISQFLSVAKDEIKEVSVENLNNIINDLFPLLSSDALKHDKEIKLQLEDIPDISLNEKEICQLILNLVRNGLEAMEPKKAVTIATSYNQVNDELILSVKDEGKGISSENIDKLGTPFFTTKDNGTGLGLSVCYNIAKKHGAVMDIESSCNGTTFSVRFNSKNDDIDNQEAN
ncbi:MAG: MASE3 domain-containing protein [Bacillota bacterium]|nr:MASE3 domain-containing protein [Bacillota bacterium]